MAHFIGGLRQQIQHTLNLFNPLTISEAHQQALTVEPQNKTIFSWNSTRQRSTTTTFPPAITNPTPTDTTVVPVDQTRLARTGTLRCFACGEFKYVEIEIFSHKSNHTFFFV